MRWRNRPVAAYATDRARPHPVRVCGDVFLFSIFSADIQRGQSPSFGRGFTGSTTGNVLGAAMGQELGQTSTEFISRRMSTAAPIESGPPLGAQGQVASFTRR